MTSVSPQGSGPQRPGRAVPDEVDLRLLGAMIGGPEIGLPQAAFQAGLSQQEAAGRLIEMAAAGLPLRLAAQGDPALLWQIVQRGPVSYGRRPAEQSGWLGGSQGAESTSFADVGRLGPIGRSVNDPAPARHPWVQGPGGPAAPGTGADLAGRFDSAPRPDSPPRLESALRPESAPRPDSEQPDAARRPDPVAGAGSPAAADPAGSAALTWGIPGTAAWAGRHAAPSETTDPPAGVASAPTATAEDQRSAVLAASAQAAHEAGPAIVRPVGAHPATGTAQQAVGLSGERLSVTVAEVIDPGTTVLTAAGYRLDERERAVLVRTVLTNDGPARHESLPDAYLFLLDGSGTPLPKAPMAVAGRSAHRVGIEPSATSDGWTIFLVPVDAAIIGVRWCVRPDLADRSLTWSL